MPAINDNEQLRQLLQNHRTLAIVGLSPDDSKASNEVARYLRRHQYRIVPVNPQHHEVLGEVCYPSLKAIPFPVDMVVVFRPGPACPPIAAEAVSIRAQALWLQLGIVSEEAQRIAEAGGLTFVMDRCTKIEHARLGVDG